jgi:hypothetical protein
MMIRAQTVETRVMVFHHANSDRLRARTSGWLAGWLPRKRTGRGHAALDSAAASDPSVTKAAAVPIVSQRTTTGPGGRVASSPLPQQHHVEYHPHPGTARRSGPEV